MDISKSDTSKLHQLYEKFGQSVWLDNLRRDWIDTGELAKWITKGCRGITSNPTIFAKSMAMAGSYDSQLKSLEDEPSIENVYWQLVTSDIRSALKLLHPIYEASNGVDGYVSVEVSPTLADSFEETVTAARELHNTLDAPNLLIKVPATPTGVKVVQELVGLGINVNVTLIFSLERYEEVMDAYIKGLQTYEGDLSKIHSVASFFISRVDTEVDRRLEEIATPVAISLKGKAAVAQAQLAYQLFLKRFGKADFETLTKERSANLQRPLWASVSTKNPEYPDTLYVDTLIGPDSVSTMPDETLEAFLDHGKLERTLDADPSGSQTILEGLAEVGVNMMDVGQRLENEGVSAFSKSFEEALEILATQRSDLR